LTAVLHPASLSAQRAATEQKTAAQAAPAVQKEELTATQWAERGFAAASVDEKLRFYNEAMRLNPHDADAYSSRGDARRARGDVEGAVKDYTEAIQLKPRPVHFYSCFISFSTRDEQFAQRLYQDLTDKGVKCWFSPHDIRGGEKIHEQIEKAISIYDRLLLILSDHSMHSPWVETEITKARKRELQEKRRMLFPISLVGYDVLRKWECIDPDTGADSAREIREFFIPDFSKWEEPKYYQEALERLLRDLTQNP
jgi:tetratricopeptide (TPR) repeat protein